MCEALVGLRKAMGSYAAGFDAALISAADAARVVADASAIEKMAATVKALAAARLAETELWRRDGDRSPAHHLARTTGTSVSQAGEAIETAKRLQQLDKTNAAARRGELSPQQAAAIADAASADPSAEERLLDLAAGASLAELRDEAARTKAAALPDPEARRRKIHDERLLRDYTDASGAWNLRARDNPEVAAAIMARLAPSIDELFKKARAEGRNEPREAYAMDALAELARSSGAGGGRAGPATRAPAKIIARVDLAALFRGMPTDGEVCELLGYGPVATSTISEMIEAGGFLALAGTRAEQVHGEPKRAVRPRSSITNIR